MKYKTTQLETNNEKEVGFTILLSSSSFPTSFRHLLSFARIPLCFFRQRFISILISLSSTS